MALRNAVDPVAEECSNRRTAGNVRGMYAVRVKGRVPEDVEAELESRGIKYRPRDQTDID